MLLRNYVVVQQKIIPSIKKKLYCFYGIDDHIHILSDLHPSIALADYIKDIKVSSSKLFKEYGIDLDEKWFWSDS